MPATVEAESDESCLDCELRSTVLESAKEMPHIAEIGPYDEPG
jgi:hypothetical protein